jgi:hypothetical protein
MVGQIESRLRLLWEESGRPTSGLVFHVNGKPIQPKRDWLAWRALIERASTDESPLPVIALHAARNSASSVMEAVKIPDRMATQIMGQSQVQTLHGYQSADEVRIREGLEDAATLLELD